MEENKEYRKGAAMKRLYLIGGTMGVGKTSVCQALKRMLPDCVFLDGDWCWDAHPFTVNAETKEMVMRNIVFLLGQFLRCSAYQNVVFCWVMHEQAVIDGILSGLEAADCEIAAVSLLCREDTLRARLEKDVRAGLRESDIIEKSVARLPLYESLDTIKIHTDDQSVGRVAEQIAALMESARQ